MGYIQLSLVQVTDSLRQYANAHSQLRSFRYGLNNEQEASGTALFPELAVWPDRLVVNGSEMNLTLNISVYDLQQSDEDNVLDGQSDLLQVCVDTVNFLKRNQGYFWNVKSSSTATPFKNRNNSSTVGWNLTVTLDLINFQDMCNIPGVTPFNPSALDFVDANFSPCVTITCFSGVTISGGQFFSGTTPLEQIILELASGDEDITRVQPGANVFTGGTGNNPVINLVDSPSVNNLTASGLTLSNAFSATTLSGGSIFSGSTDLSFIFQTISSDNNDITRVQPGANIATGGTGNNPTVNLVASPSINGLTFSGTAIGNNFSANTISGGTFFSGSTPLQTIIQNLIPADQNDITRVQPGRNILTGGTANDPTVNLVDSPSVNNLTASGLTLSNTFSANTVSGGTFFSGSTDLYNIFATSSSSDVTRVQPGTNILTGGTDNFPTVNLVASPSVNNLTASGLTLSNTFSANTVSGGTFFSGSTDLGTIIQSFIPADQNDITRVQPGTNITTGGTGNNPTVNLVASPSINGLTFSGSAIGNTFSANTVSGGTFFSGSTDLGAIIQSFIPADQNDITRVQPGTNILTGGTDNFPTVNLVANPSINNLTASGLTLSNTFSANTVSGGTFFSGSTDLGTIIQSFIPADQNDITRVQPGLNTYTGGTANNPNVNVSGLTIDNINVSGDAVFNSIIVQTISGDSGSSSEISMVSSAITLTTDSGGFTTPFIFVNPSVAQMAGYNSADVSLTAVHTLVNHGLLVDISAPLTQVTGSLNVSGGTLSSGGTDLYNIFLTSNDGNDITRVQPGTNITTGGTGNNPTVNLVDSPSVNNLSSSGFTLANAFSANTVSGGTFYSGSTSLETIIQSFVPPDQNDITRVQPGTNIITGGTGNNPTVNLVDSPSINNLTASGLTLSNTFSANTVSGGTFFSGSTDLGTIIQSFIPADQNDITRVQPGTNIITGGTGNNPTVNLVDSPSVNGLSFSGTAIGSALSATTLSGGSIFSGSTSLETIIQSFIQPDQNDITRVQPGTNIITGGTDNFPTVNLVDSPSVDGISFSGTAIGSILSANTISGITLSLEDRILLREVGTISATPLNFGGLQTEDFHDKTVLMYSDSGGTVGRIMRDSLFVARNITGSQINKGKYVSITGSTGDAPRIALAIATTEMGGATGVAYEDIPDNGFGYVMRSGLLKNFNTAAFNSGDQLYLSTTSPGDFTDIRPEHPYFAQQLGIVLVSAVGSGSIEVDTDTPIQRFYSGNTFYILSGLSVATSVSASTYYSGTTDLGDLFATKTEAKQEAIGIAVSDETTALTTGAAKVTFRMPYAMTLTSVRASLTTSGSTTTTVDINQNGASVLSTLITLDNGNFSSLSAATQPIILTSSLLDDANMTIDIDGAGTSAAGLKVWLKGTRV